jgi:hypothetical protein
MYNKYQKGEKIYLKDSDIIYVIEFILFSEEQKTFLYSLILDNNEKNITYLKTLHTENNIISISQFRKNKIKKLKNQILCIKNQ